MRARWLVLGLVLGAITIWALLTGFLNQHEIRGMLTLNDICFHGTSRFEGCLNNATLIPTFNGTVTAGNASCAPETTYDADGLFLNWTCIPIPPPTTVVQLNGSVIGPSNNNTLACTTVTAGTYGGADLVSLQVGCDGRIVNISNGGVALTATTQFNGDVTGVFNNLSLTTIPGLPANWSVGSSSCIPFLEGDNKGRIHYQACINLSVTALPNGTVFLSTPHETTIMNNGSAITFGTVQPIDVTSTPTFAGITINGAGEFNANGAPLAGLTLPTSAPVLLTGRAATSGVFGDYLFTPVLAFYNGANTPPTRVDQCRNVDDCLTMFDGYTSQVPFPTAFDWLGSTPGFTPYAIWKNSNALNFLAFTQPGSPSAQVTPISLLTLTPAAAAFMIPVTMTGTLIVSGAVTAQSTMDVTGTLTAHGNALIDGTQEVVGTATFDTGILLPTLTGSPTLLNYYEEFSYSFQIHGPFASNQPGAPVIGKINRVGKLVSVYLPRITEAPITTSSCILFTPAPPTRFGPNIVADIVVPIVVDGGGGSIVAQVEIFGGPAAFQICQLGGGPFTSGTIGFATERSFSYALP